VIFNNKIENKKTKLIATLPHIAPFFAAIFIFYDLFINDCYGLFFYFDLIFIPLGSLENALRECGLLVENNWCEMILIAIFAFVVFVIPILHIIIIVICSYSGKIKIALATLSLYILIYTSILIIDVSGIMYEVAPGVTGDSIKKIELGMSKDEVISILGKPLGVSQYVCLGANRRRQYLEWINEKTWRNKISTVPAPSLEIGFDNDYRVDIIRAYEHKKRAVKYRKTIYYLSLDESTGEKKYYVNEELLKKYFR